MMTSIFKQSTFISSVVIFQYHQRMEYFTAHTLFQSLCPVQGVSRYSSVDDAKATQITMHCFYVEVIDTKIIRSSSLSSYEIFISQMTIFDFLRRLLSLSRPILLPDMTVYSTVCVLQEAGTTYPLRVPGFPQFLVGSVLFFFLVFCVVFFVCVASLPPVS